MCGILGYFGFDKNARSKVESAIRHINRRGPDGKGSWSNEQGDLLIDFFHTRLSIIDTEHTSNQPMKDSRGDWLIIYNGEIFNFLELRKTLEHNGVLFSTKSDTEVVLKAWLKWGENSLPRLNGMFAFAVYHVSERTLWLARDRFGEKPLYWSLSPRKDSLLFSSSVAAIADINNEPVNIEYCSFGLRYKVFDQYTESSPFENVRSLLPGTWLRVKVKGNFLETKLSTWYDLKTEVNLRLADSLQKSDEALLQECAELLDDSIKIRLRSDVPLAVSLSGGLDSSTIASIVVRKVQGLNGYTYGSPLDMSSEGPAVQLLSRDLGITPTYVWPHYNKVSLDALLERTYISQEAPFPSTSVMAQNELYRNVSNDSFKVLLGGQGGDEIFGGYRKFFFIALMEAIAKRKGIDALSSVASIFLMLINEFSSAATYWRALDRYGKNRNAEFNILNWETNSANLWGSVNQSFRERQADDVLFWSLPSLLRYEDRNSMGHGVESRLPFLDFRLVELALSLPTRLKIHNGFGKWSLRVLAKSLVPDYIRLNRKKRGFDVSQPLIHQGLGECLRERILSNKNYLGVHMKNIGGVDRLLSDDLLSKNSDLLDECLMLGWLAQPVRNPS